MSKRPYSPKSRASQACPAFKRCPSLTGAAAEEAAEEKLKNNKDLPQELLCDDSLLHVLSYADTSSLVHFTRGTNNALRDRCRATLDHKLWKDTFYNHNLAPLDADSIEKL